MLFHPQFALFFLLVGSLSAPRVQASCLSAIYPSYLSAEGYLVGRPFPVLTAGSWHPAPTPSHEQRSCPGFSGVRFHLALATELVEAAGGLWCHQSPGKAGSVLAACRPLVLPQETNPGDHSTLGRRRRWSLCNPPGLLWPGVAVCLCFLCKGPAWGSEEQRPRGAPSATSLLLLAGPSGAAQPGQGNPSSHRNPPCSFPRASEIW